MSIASITLALIVLLHGTEVNQDRQNYLNYVTAISSGNAVPIEPAWYLIINTLDLLFDNSALEAAFIYLTAFAAISIKLSLFRKYGEILTGCTIIYLSYYFIVYDIVQIRVGLAVSFLYLSWFSLATENRKNFYLFGIISSLCHISCLLFIAGIFIKSHSHSTSKKSKVVITVTLLTSVITSIAYPQYLASSITALSNVVGLGKLTEYLLTFEDGAFAKISYLRIIPYIAILLLFKANKKHWVENEIIRFQVTTLKFGIIAFIALSPIPVFAYRISDLFIFSSIFLIGNARRFMTAGQYSVFIFSFTTPILYYTSFMSGIFIK